MSIFASVIGPFGGFFASGFKRAFKIKVTLLKLAYSEFHKESKIFPGDKTIYNFRRISETLFLAMVVLWIALIVSS